MIADVISLLNKNTQCLIDSPKLKKLNTFCINVHEIVLNAFSKSIIRRSPGIFVSSVKFTISYINLVFSPIYRPLINPVWSVEINLDNTVYSFSAIQPNAILYVSSNRVIGCQFLRNSLGLSPFGRQVIIPCL